jgi:hypothetical protein
VLFAIYDTQTLTMIGETGLAEINHRDGTAKEVGILATALPLGNTPLDKEY